MCVRCVVRGEMPRVCVRAFCVCACVRVCVCGARCGAARAHVCMCGARARMCACVVRARVLCARGLPFDCRLVLRIEVDLRLLLLEGEIEAGVLPDRVRRLRVGHVDRQVDGHRLALPDVDPIGAGEGGRHPADDLVSRHLLGAPAHL